MTLRLSTFHSETDSDNRFQFQTGSDPTKKIPLRVKLTLERFAANENENAKDSLGLHQAQAQENEHPHEDGPSTFRAGRPNFDFWDSRGCFQERGQARDRRGLEGVQPKEGLNDNDSSADRTTAPNTTLTECRLN